MNEISKALSRRWENSRIERLYLHRVGAGMQGIVMFDTGLSRANDAKYATLHVEVDGCGNVSLHSGCYGLQVDVADVQFENRAEQAMRSFSARP